MTTPYAIVISNPGVFLATLQQLEALLNTDAGITVVIPDFVEIISLRSQESEHAKAFLDAHRARMQIAETGLKALIAEGRNDLEGEISFLRNSGVEYEFANAQIRVPGRKTFVVADDWLERNEVPTDDRLFWIRVSDFISGKQP